MGKNEETGLGMTLVKQHNQMIQQSKEKGLFYKAHHKKVLQSVIDVSDIDAVIEQADCLFSLHHSTPNLLIKLDTSSSSYKTTGQSREQQMKEEEL